MILKKRRLKEIRDDGQRQDLSVLFIFRNPGKINNLERRQRDYS